MSDETLALGQIWVRAGGCERVEIVRLWGSTIGGTEPIPAVRCRPLHGGKQWWAYTTDFLERFQRENERAVAR